MVEILHADQNTAIFENDLGEKIYLDARNPQEVKVAMLGVESLQRAEVIATAMVAETKARSCVIEEGHEGFLLTMYFGYLN